MAGLYFLVFLFLISHGCSLELEGNEEGDDLHEGDIQLNPSQRLALFLFNDPTKPITLGRGITANSSYLWPHTIPYTISPELMNQTDAVSAIQEGIEEWHQRTCLEFVPRTNEKDYINFFWGSGCWSWVGKQGGKQNVSLKYGCWSRGTVAHELGHAMGFWHEQSRPDRDEYVQIKWENIPEEKRHNFNKYNRSQVDSLGVPYDYLSMMHYSKTAFGINGSVTISALKTTWKDLQLGQRLGMSPSDEKQADLLYNCNGVKTSPKIYNPPTFLTFDVPGEWGGFTNDENDDFDWEQRLGATPSGGTGPTGDHTTGGWGWFLYIETSSPRTENETATLRSSVYHETNMRCLRFYYHMYGSHMGSLDVSYRLVDQTNDVVVWTRTGSQGDGWKLASVELPSSQNGLQIAFTGKRGNGYRGDIAIDDLYFTDGSCDGSTAV